jgi:hypothetical protein
MQIFSRVLMVSLLACLGASQAYAGYSFDVPQVVMKLVDSTGQPIQGFPVQLEINGEEFKLESKGPFPIPLPRWSNAMFERKTYLSDAQGRVVVPAQSISSASPVRRDGWASVIVGKRVFCEKEGWDSLFALPGRITFADGSYFLRCELSMHSGGDIDTIAKAAWSREVTCQAASPLEVAKVRAQIQEAEAHCL